MGAGLRTWLNAGVLSFAFIVIIFYNGLIDGWNEQAKRDGINWDYGYGHLLNESYDEYDPFSFQDGVITSYSIHYTKLYELKASSIIGMVLLKPCSIHVV